MNYDLDATSSYPLTLCYDGLCPVCNLKMDNLKARNPARHAGCEPMP